MSSADSADFLDALEAHFQSSFTVTIPGADIRKAEGFLALCALDSNAEENKQADLSARQNPALLLTVSDVVRGVFRRRLGIQELGELRRDAGMTEFAWSSFLRLLAAALRSESGCSVTAELLAGHSVSWLPAELAGPAGAPRLRLSFRLQLAAATIVMQTELLAAKQPPPLGGGTEAYLRDLRTLVVGIYAIAYGACGNGRDGAFANTASGPLLRNESGISPCVSDSLRGAALSRLPSGNVSDNCAKLARLPSRANHQLGSSNIAMERPPLTANPDSPRGVASGFPAAAGGSALASVPAPLRNNQEGVGRVVSVNSGPVAQTSGGATGPSLIHSTSGDSIVGGAASERPQDRRGPQTSTGAPPSGSSDVCYKCRGTGHWARDCPNVSATPPPARRAAPAVPAPASKRPQKTGSLLDPRSRKTARGGANPFALG